jgi:hypothetical protein
MSTVIDFRVQDIYQHSRVLDDGSISIEGSNLDPEVRMKAWSKNNAPAADGIEAWPVKGA